MQRHSLNRWADCGANQAELALSGADYAIINSESDLFDLVLELEGDTSYQTLVLDALDGFQDVLLDERLGLSIMFGPGTGG